MSDSREAFEVFWRNEMNAEVFDLVKTAYPFTSDENQQYLCHETNRAWITWQHQQSRIDALKQENAAQRAKISAARAEALEDAAKVCEDAGFKDLAHDVRRLKEQVK